jgi:hypothetical protein
LKRCLAVLLLLCACSSAPPPPPLVAPEWDVIPEGVVDALCQRLHGDRFNDDMVMVKLTQPIVTTSAIAALYPLKDRPLEMNAPPTRAIPVTTTGGCKWRAIDASQRSRYRDSVVVDLSAPLLNPVVKKEAGVFARVSTGDESEWFWIAFRSHEGAWVLSEVRAISVH